MNRPQVSPSITDVSLGLLPLPAVLVTSDGQIVASNPAFQALVPEVATWWQPREEGVLAEIREPASDVLELKVGGDSYCARAIRLSHLGDEMRLWQLESAAGRVSEEEKQRDEYVSMVVHDLRGPAAGIRGTLDFVLEDPEISLPEMHRDFLEEARDEASRMMNLVGEILDFSRIRAGRFEAGLERVRTEVLVRRAILSVRSLASREGIAVEADVPRPIAAIAGNDEKLLQVLNNFLVNAFKFTPQGHLIVVSAREFRDGDRPRVLLAVTDTGPGIEFEKQSELFRKFAEVGTRTDKQIAGTGLGLFITKAIVEAMGGSVHFASIPGAGTSFFCDLPAWKETADESRRSTGEFQVESAG